jgi:hypothetical protein
LESDFKLEGKSVDEAALAEEVARRVRERRDSGVYSKEVESMLAERLPEEEEFGKLPPVAELDYSATSALSTWEVTTAYPVATEKRFLRPLVILLKRLARKWAAIAVGPIHREQSTFNLHAASALSALRREALSEREQTLAEEQDLCLLAEALIGEDESEGIANAVLNGLAGTERLLVFGPCPLKLKEHLEEGGLKLTNVSPGSSWDAEQDGKEVRSGPLAFVSQVPEASLPAVLLPELSFWLKPEKLLGLIRRSYLVLAPGGRLALAVHGFAAAGPAPGWCSREVVENALSIAGFKDIKTIDLTARGAPSGFVTLAGK